MKLIPVMPRHRWDTLADDSTVMAAHRLLSSVMCSNVGINWPVHSLMLPFHDLRILPLWWLLYHPLFLVVWISTAYHDGRRGQNIITCNTLWLIVKAPDIWWQFDPLPYIFILVRFWKSGTWIVPILFDRVCNTDNKYISFFHDLCCMLKVLVHNC